MPVSTMIRQLVTTSEPHAAFVLTANLGTVELGRTREMSRLVALKVAPAFGATATTFELAHVLVTASEVTSEVFGRIQVPTAYIGAVLNGTFVVCKTLFFICVI